MLVSAVFGVSVARYRTSKSGELSCLLMVKGDSMCI